VFSVWPGVLRWSGRSGVRTLARHRPVKGVTLTGLPDLGRGLSSIRCHIRVAICARIWRRRSHAPWRPLSLARQRRASGRRTGFAASLFSVSNQSCSNDNRQVLSRAPKWSAPFVFRGVKNRKFFPQRPRTDSQRPGKQMTLHVAGTVP